MSTSSGAATKRRGLGAATVAVALLAATGCSSTSAKTGDATTSVAPATTRHAVGQVTETFVDSSRPTPRSGDNPERAERTLKTVVFYPTVGAADFGKSTAGAAPARTDGPYPLIMFSHGLGSDPLAYAAVLSRWAAFGYVVAAPYFPLTSSTTAGSTDASDVINQPGDVSFLITKLLAASASGSGTVNGLIDPDAIGAAGHSNGALTTLGLVANTCCHDARVRAAVVLAGNPVVFGDGKYDYTNAPPLLLVHGTRDELLPYDEAVNIFNVAHGPKGLLTVEGGDHEKWLSPSNPAFASVMKTTTDFFAAYLKNDKGARGRLATDGKSSATHIRFDPRAGSTSTIATAPAVKADRHASVTPTKDLTNGQMVSVSWSGFTPGKVVNIVQCAPGPLGSSAPCDLVHAQILKPDPTGSGSLQLQIVVGPVGTGICDAEHQGCLIAVNDGSSQEPDATIRIPISVR